MPLRAFFVFGRTLLQHAAQGDRPSSNALAGIFCFWTYGADIDSQKAFGF